MHLKRERGSIKWPFRNVHALRRSVLESMEFTTFNLHLWPNFSYMGLEKNLYKMSVTNSLISQGKLLTALM